MDWLFLWLLFGGRRDRYVLVETPEQREKRQQREAEAFDRMATRIGKFLGSGVGVVLIVFFMWALYPFVLDILSGGNHCAIDDLGGGLSPVIKFLTRC
jgi:hypothetical protein